MTQPRRIFWFGLFAALLFLLPSRAAAQSAPPTDNATIQLSAPTTNNSSSANLGVQGPNLEEAFIRFDLSVLPSGLQASNINKATLRLFLANVSVGGTFDVYLVNGSWSEETITYNNAPPAGLLIVGSIPVNTSEGRDFVLVDVTEAVQKWLSGTTNNGIVLKASPGSSISVNFDSKVSSSTSHDPEIEIEVVSVGPQGPQGPEGQAATVTVGQTSTGNPGSNASVANGGTPNAAVLNFIIPRGQPGATGATGQSVAGLTEPPGTNCAFGGTKFVAANGTTFACNGVTGATGGQGPPGPLLPDLVYTDKDNTLMSNQTVQGNLALAPTGTATSAQGYASNPLDLAASVSDGANTHNETFRWQSVPLNNGTANFGAQLSLLYGGGTTPTPTGFSANPDGSLNFVGNQVFTGKHVGDGSGLTNLPNTFTAAGDLTGSPTSQTVSKLQGQLLSLANTSTGTGSGTITTPQVGSVLGFNGTAWTAVPGFSLGGDLSGTASSQLVNGLHGQPLSLGGTATTAAPPPQAGSVLGFNGAAWTAVPGFSPNGDLAGSATNQRVIGLQGTPLLLGGTGGLSAGQVLGFNGTAWVPATVPAGPSGPQGPQGPAGPPGPVGSSSSSVLPAFLPGPLTQAYTAVSLVPDSAITVTRISAAFKTAPDANCPPSVLRLTNGTTGQDLLVTAGQSVQNTGAMSLPIQAGTNLQLQVQSPAKCTQTNPGDANVLVVYRGQLSTDTQVCAQSGLACNGICEETQLDPNNCGACGNACVTQACFNGVCGGCNSAAGCPVNQACDPNTKTCVSTCSTTSPCNGGCCQNGICMSGASISACGANGGTCLVCGSFNPCLTGGGALTCPSGACVDTRTPSPNGTVCGTNMVCASGQCLGASGAQCSSNAQCASGVCISGVCQGTACGSASAFTHSNGAGQFYVDCNPLGTPGNPATYIQTMAQEAAAAFSTAAATSLACNGAGAVGASSTQGFAVWVYQGTLAGYVLISPSQFFCPSPTSFSATWN